MLNTEKLVKKLEETGKFQCEDTITHYRTVVYGKRGKDDLFILGSIDNKDNKILSAEVKVDGFVHDIYTPSLKDIDELLNLFIEAHSIYITMEKLENKIHEINWR